MKSRKAVLAAVITAITVAGSGSAAAVLPLGSIGLLAPQLGLAASLPVLVPAALLVGGVIIGGAALANKASKKGKGKKKRKGR